MSSRNSASPQQLSREEEKQGSYGIVMNESLNNNHNDMQSQSSNFGGICSTPIIEELNKLSISKKKLSSSTIDSLSLQSSTGESLPASYCDTDAALFQFADFEMLEDEEDDVDIEMDRNYLHSSKENGNMLSTKRRIQSNGNDHKGKDTDMKGKPKGSEPQDLIKTELILFGIDLSHLSSVQQFFISASGVIGFNMVYGYLQELIQIKIAGRSFAIFLGSCQFLGYAFWSYALAKMRARLLRKRNKIMNVDEVKRLGGEIYASLLTEKGEANVISSKNEDNLSISPSKTKSMGVSTSRASWGTYFALSVIRAIDLALTNLSMKYLNYPAKTLIKSSRVIFTMLLGLVIGKKKYKRTDYIMVIMLVVGLALFLHADMHTSAVFHPIGVAMLATSLTLDATVSNWSELIMKKHNLGQDDFQMKLYSFSFLIMLSAAYLMNELWSGIEFFFMSDGTYNEFLSDGGGSSSRTTTSGASEIQLTTAWMRNDKIIAVILFSTLGIFGGSCAAAITKRFGALTMSITTTTRKAATIFLSFAMFNNECTPEHVCGVFIFVSGLLMKGLKNHIKIPRWSLPFPKTFLTRFRVGGGGGMQRSRETAT